jgi:hypothetical protein
LLLPMAGRGASGPLSGLRVIARTIPDVRDLRAWVSSEVWVAGRARLHRYNHPRLAIRTSETADVTVPQTDSQLAIDELSHRLDAAMGATAATVHHVTALRIVEVQPPMAKDESR